MPEGNLGENGTATVTLEDRVTQVVVTAAGGELWVTTDGSNPDSPKAGTVRVIPARSPQTIPVSSLADPTVVKLRSPNGAGYTVTAGPQTDADSGSGATDTEVAASIADLEARLIGTTVAPTSVGREILDTTCSAALRTFHAALANRHYAACNMFHLGDSTTEGEGANTVGRRWQNRLLNQLRHRFPVPGVNGGDNYFPPWYASSLPAPAVLGGSPTTGGNGLGKRDVRLTTGSHTVTWTVTGSSVDIVWTRSAGAGVFAYTVDGGSPVTVDTDGAGAVSRRTPVVFSVPGEHVVAVVWSSGAQVVIEGLVVYYGDETLGIRGFDGGHFGNQSSHFLSIDSEWYSAMSWVAPALVTVNLVINDFKQGVAAATYKANIEAIIGEIRVETTTVPDPSIVLILPPAMGTNDYAYPWADYVEATYEIAAADVGGANGASGICVFDVGRRILPVTVDTSLGLISSGDLTHYPNKGQAYLADALLEFLCPR